MNPNNSNQSKNRNSNHPHGDWKNNPSSVALFSIILITAGVILLLNSFEIIPDNISHIIISWPMLLIAIGIFGFTKERHNFGNLMLLTIGVFFLVPRMWNIDNYESTFWPIMLILLGILMITRFSSMKSRLSDVSKSANQGSDDLIDDVSIFGGGERIYTTQNFQGGKITAIFGGSEIDLSRAKLAQGTNVLEVTFIFGGSNIIVPQNWRIQMETTSIFGSVSDKRRVIDVDSFEKDTSLIIKGSAIFGGGEIKSY